MPQHALLEVGHAVQDDAGAGPALVAVPVDSEVDRRLWTMRARSLDCPERADAGECGVIVK